MKKPAVTFIQKQDFSVSKAKKWKDHFLVNARDTLIVFGLIALFIFK